MRMLSLIQQRLSLNLASVAPVARRFGLTTGIGEAAGWSFQPQTRRTLVTSVARLQPATDGTATKRATKTRAKTTVASSTAPKKTKASAATPDASAKKKSAASKPKATKKASTAAKDKPKPVKKGVIKKEDLPPKAPPGPYALFVQMRYSLPAAELGDRSAIASISSESARLWKELPEEEKQAYKDRAKDLREAYKKDLDAYFERIPSGVLRMINKRRRETGHRVIHKTPGKSGRPLTAFFVYLKEHRPRLTADCASEGVTGRPAVPVIAQRAGQEWRNMSQAEKQRYGSAPLS